MDKAKIIAGVRAEFPEAKVSWMGAGKSATIYVDFHKETRVVNLALDTPDMTEAELLESVLEALR